MHKVEVNEFSSSTIRLLANIESLLKEQNQLLKQAFLMPDTQIAKDNKIENKANIDTVGRIELLAIIKGLPKGTIPGKYMTMPLEELRKSVKEVLK